MLDKLRTKEREIEEREVEDVEDASDERPTTPDQPALNTLASMPSSFCTAKRQFKTFLEIPLPPFARHNLKKLKKASLSSMAENVLLREDLDRTKVAELA